MPGVRKVVEVPSGVAVIADGFWAAKRGRDVLQIEWDEGPMADFNNKSQREQYAELAKQPGLSARKEGDASGAIGSAAKKIEAVYEVPYLSHAMMEPLNCAVDLRADGCEIWTGTQFQTVDRMSAAGIAGLKPEQVQIHYAAGWWFWPACESDVGFCQRSCLCGQGCRRASQGWRACTVVAVGRTFAHRLRERKLH